MPGHIIPNRLAIVKSAPIPAKRRKPGREKAFGQAAAIEHRNAFGEDAFLSSASPSSYSVELSDTDESMGLSTQESYRGT